MYITMKIFEKSILLHISSENIFFNMKDYVNIYYTLIITNICNSEIFSVKLYFCIK